MDTLPDRDTLLSHVAPCSLLCYTCPAYKDGIIAESAETLRRHFEGYYDFNDRNLPDGRRAWLDTFAAFYGRLERYTKRPCVGCRNSPSPGSGCVEGCVIPACTKEKGIVFCAQCAAFPCDKVDAAFGGNPVIHTDWLRGNERIRAVGAAQYFQEREKVSHYIGYKKA